MAEFQKVVKEYRRMCNSYLSCDNCPLYVNAQSARTCKHDVFLNPEEAERIIMQWAAEHPIKTNGMKFKEIFGMDVQWENIEGMKAWLDAEYGEGQNENQNN